jgi:hypothetical protein
VCHQGSQADRGLAHEGGLKLPREIVIVIQFNRKLIRKGSGVNREGDIRGRKSHGLGKEIRGNRDALAIGAI